MYQSILVILTLTLVVFSTAVSFAETEVKRDTIPLYSGESYDSALTENRINQVIRNDGNIGATIRAFFVEEICASADNNPIACDVAGAQIVDVEPTSFVKTLNIIIGAIAILYIVILGVRIIFSEGDEEKLTGSKKTLGLIVAGLILVALAQYIAFMIMDPVKGDILNADTGSISAEVYDKVALFVRAISIFIGVILLINLTISGYRLMTSQGEDERIGREKTFLKNFLLGVFMILFAESIIQIFAAMGGKSLPGSDAEGIEAGAMAQIGVIEIVGVINFILGFVAIAALIMFLLAVIYLLISFGNDERVGRAKTIVINTLIGILVCMAAYGIVNLLLNYLTNIAG